MKRLIYLTACLAVVCSCNRAPSYTIDGHFSGIANETVLLMKRVGKNYVVVDSLKAEEGRFRMTGNTGFPDLYYIEIAGHNGRLSFFIENSEIYIEGNCDSIADATVKGSLTNDQYVAYNKLLSEFDTRQHGIAVEYTAAESNGDTALSRKLYDEYVDIEKQKTAFQVEYVKSNGSSYVVPPIIRSASIYMEPEQIEELVNCLDENVSRTPIIEIVKTRIESLNNTRVGMLAPDFLSKDTTGHFVRFHDRLGAKLLLLDFWASWCGPCRKTNPELVKLYSEYSAKGFEIFGVSLDRTRDDWVGAIAADGLQWMHVSDLDYWDCEAVSRYGVVAIPTTLLVNEKGEILGKNLSLEELAGILDKTLSD